MAFILGGLGIAALGSGAWWWSTSRPALPPQIQQDIEMFDRTNLRNISNELKQFDVAKLRPVERVEKIKLEDPLETALRKKFANT